jgi:hypothetical protein
VKWAVPGGVTSDGSQAFIPTNTTFKRQLKAKGMNNYVASWKVIQWRWILSPGNSSSQQNSLYAFAGACRGTSYNWNQILPVLSVVEEVVVHTLRERRKSWLE